MDPIEDTRDRLLLLLARRDPAKLLFRIANTEQPGPDETTRRGVNARKDGLVNDFPKVTIDVEDESSAMYAQEDAPLDVWETMDDDETEFPHQQSYTVTVVHEGENKRLNNRTDRNVVAAFAAGGPRLADPAPTGGGDPTPLAWVFSWSYVARRTLEWVGTSVRWVTRFTVTVNMVVTRSEILSIPLPDPAKKGEA